MNHASQELLDLLDLELLELDLFRGIGTGGETSTRIFGGHVIAQALAAAYRSVDGRPILYDPVILQFPWSIRLIAHATAVALPRGAWSRCKTANRF